MVVKWQNQSATVMLFSVSGSLWWEGAPLAPVCLGADSQWPYFLVRNQSNTQVSGSYQRLLCLPGAQNPGKCRENGVTSADCSRSLPGQVKAVSQG